MNKPAGYKKLALYRNVGLLICMMLNANQDKLLVRIK